MSQRNPGTLLTEVGCHCVRLAAAALGQFGKAARSVQQGPLPSRVAEVAVAVVDTNFGIVQNMSNNYTLSNKMCLWPDFIQIKTKSNSIN